MVGAYWRGIYPPFAYSAKPCTDYFPVFFYHQARKEEFDTHLRYLLDNGYEAVTGDEVVKRLGGQVLRRTHEVMLTFDDGLASLYEEAFPLLVQYRMRAVAYIVPAWIGQPGFLTWDQVRKMHESGHVDFQSHSNAHNRIVSYLEVRDIWLRRTPADLPWGLPGIERWYLERPREWLPILSGASLFEDVPAKIMPAEFWNECLEIGLSKEVNGQALKEHARRALELHRVGVIEELPADRFLRMKRSLEDSMNNIEAKLPGHRVRHFAFPWSKSSALAWRALADTGFLSGAIGLEPAHESGEGRASVMRILRVNGDYCLCLPGKGRRTFLRVTAAKALRRLTGTSVYGPGLEGSNR